MRTTYRPRVPSPIQIARSKAYDIKRDGNPVKEELKKHYGTFHLDVSFEEDEASANAFKHISGYLPVLCTLRKDGKVIALGRGASILTPMNRSIQRAVFGAINGSFLSAANNATKVFDLLRLEDAASKAAAYPLADVEPQPATEKQKAWLRELIILNVEDDTERQERINALDDLSKDEASQQIQMLAR